MRKYLVWASVVLLILNIGLCLSKKRKVKPPPSPPIAAPVKPLVPVLPPITNQISNAQPAFLTYAKTVIQLQQWQSEAPELAEVNTYGQSAKQKELYYIRVGNKRVKGNPCVLITACIHGNEPLSSSTIMWYIGALLSRYGKDEGVTRLLDTRDIYFVPVVSPDSYPNSRHVDGVDPNRDFPGPSRPSHQSTPAIAALQKLFERISPKAVISAHTWGRVFLVPYGDKMADSPNHADYSRIIGRMAELSGYRWFRACDMYKSGGGLNNPPVRAMGLGAGYSIPIHGSEVDWYYRHGAFSIVMELGTHQNVPSDSDTHVEFEKTFSSVLHFLQEAPLVNVSQE